MKLIGPLTGFGTSIATSVLVIDQCTKLFVLHTVDFGADGLVRVTPFMDLVQTWNTGVSYGLFPQGVDGWWILGGLKLIAAIAFFIWLAQVWRPIEAMALGLLIGGALGNAIDRALYGAVFDFVSLHAFGYRWYVFNVADIAIVVGVVLLLYDSMLGRAVKSPPSSES
ncbi:signal peptidase II [Starkeya sp. ORNL1]|uniref:signal peptidase II n=1 Tax=Starkeya sp. ORNL1 TaxID=2709380 RepID=UPI001FED89A5|nr:signal peptidase II [Starkeya sp. ORNL1]